MKKETRSETVVREVFIASDGREFDSEYDCAAHEEDLEIEREFAVADPLLVDTKFVNWPLLTDRVVCGYNENKWDHYRWYKITCDEDLKTFCRAVDAWKYPDENRFEELRMRCNYPDYIAFVEEDEAELYTLSELVAQACAFIAVLGDPYIMQRSNLRHFDPLFGGGLEDMLVYELYEAAGETFIRLETFYGKNGKDPDGWKKVTIGKVFPVMRFLDEIGKHGTKEYVSGLLEDSETEALSEREAVKSAKSEGKGGMVFLADFDFLLGEGENAVMALPFGRYASFTGIGKEDE